MQEKKLLAGFGAGALTNAAWFAWPGHTQFRLSLVKATALEDQQKSPLAFLEHYHFGLAALAAGRAAGKYSPYLDGFGAAMIASELFQQNPFGAGKSEWELKGNFLVGMGLGLLLGWQVLKAKK